MISSNVEESSCVQMRKIEQLDASDDSHVPALDFQFLLELLLCQNNSN